MSAHWRPRRAMAVSVLAGAFTLLALDPEPVAAASATGHVSVTILPIAAAVGESTAVRFSAGPPGRLRDRLSGRGTITVSGMPYSAITLSLGPGMASLRPGAALVIGLAHDAGSSPSLGRTGVLRIAVKANATLGSSPAPGAYSGSYAVTVNY